jgi:uncharacterized protein (TIRG00374 family)
MTEPRDDEPRPLKLRILRWVPIVIVLGLVVHLVLPRVAQIKGALHIVWTLTPWAIALAVVCEGLSYCANGFLLRTIIGCITKERISFRRAAAIELGAGTVAIVAAGALGFGTAIYKWTRDGGVSRDAAMLAGWLPSVFDAMTLIVFALLSAIELLAMHQLSRATVIALGVVVTVLSVVIVTIFVLLARNDWLLRAAHFATSQLRRVRMFGDNTILIDAAERAETVWGSLRGGGWLRPAASSFCVITFDLLCLHWVFVAAGQHLHITVLVAGYGVPLLLGRASFLPGGIAVIEVAMSALYSGLGVPPNAAIVSVLVYRLISFWTPAVCGIPVAFVLQSRK